MKQLPPALLLACALLLGLGLGAGGMYAARPALPGGAPDAAPVATPEISGAPGPNAEIPGPATPEPAAPSLDAIAPAAPTPEPQPSVPETERALEGVKTGAFLPLEKLTTMLRERFPGEVLGVKLDQDDGVTYYEFKILTKAGRVMEIEVDPRTGRVLDVDEDD